MDYLESGYLAPWFGAPVREISEDELLTWEIQLKREGQLPPDVQRRLLEYVAERPVAVS